MEGRGWLIIYGVLLILVVALFVMVAGLNSRIEKLENEPAPAETETAEPEVAETPDPSESEGPDLSSPEARDTQRKADLKEIKAALMKYQSEKKSFPKELKDLSPQYLEVLPADPLAPKFTYRYQKTPAGFRLTCAIESKADVDDPKDGKRDQIYTVTEKGP